MICKRTCAYQGQKCSFFGKFFARTKWMAPKMEIMHYTYPETGHLLRAIKKFITPAKDFSLVKTTGPRQLWLSNPNFQCINITEVSNAWLVLRMHSFMFFGALDSFTINCHPAIMVFTAHNFYPWFISSFTFDICQ